MERPEAVHVPVLLEEAMSLLSVREGGIYVDGTVGLGGHAAEIVSRLGAGGRLIGIDRDEEALRYAGVRLGNGRVILRKGTFSMVRNILQEHSIGAVDGVLLDLGVSMLQMRDRMRGFSFASHERLDMRMDALGPVTAWDVVNTAAESDIERILVEYGEERQARRIAGAIVNGRRKGPIDTCSDLADIVARAIPRRGRIHPATKTFQALRIEVNDELGELRRGLDASVAVLKPGGRLCVISYHSLEDRIVKRFLRAQERDGTVRILTKKTVKPTLRETRINPSSRSAKLRGAERI
ncbi:MAG TPA: 16S rRNA (cytosine(1402)-N(4))-methyltransferase RsmH [Dissulfurispiraceae bacterium]|nr:16S rRNA (cytosine(1402)-N(4))-methyltransferase RsmH [Dissulfurispiraceae bacterium]